MSLISGKEVDNEDPDIATAIKGLGHESVSVLDEDGKTVEIKVITFNGPASNLTGMVGAGITLALEAEKADKTKEDTSDTNYDGGNFF